MARMTRSQYENTVTEIETLLGQIDVITEITSKVNQLEIERQVTIELAEKVLEDGLEGYAACLFDQVFALQNQIYTLADSADKQLARVEDKFNAGFEVEGNTVLENLYYDKLQPALDSVANELNKLYSIEDYVRVA